MELVELSIEEKTVLAAGLRLAVMADNRATEREAAVIDRVARELGQVDYEEAMERAADRAPDRERFEALAATIARPEARELIYGTLVDVALADSVTPGDQELIDALGRLWGLSVRIAGGPEPVQPGLPR